MCTNFLNLLVYYYKYNFIVYYCRIQGGIEGGRPNEVWNGQFGLPKESRNINVYIRAINRPTLIRPLWLDSQVFMYRYTPDYIKVWPIYAD